MQPLGAIPAPGRPGHIRRRAAGGTGPRRGRPTEYTLRVPGGRRTDRSGCLPPPGRGRPAGHCPGAAQVLHRGLVEHHNVSLLRLITQRPDQQELLILEGVGHGLPLYPGQTPDKGEYQYQAHQGGGQGVEPVKQILRGLLFLLLRLGAVRRGSPLFREFGPGLLGLGFMFQFFGHRATSSGAFVSIIPAPEEKCNHWALSRLRAGPGISAAGQLEVQVPAGGGPQNTPCVFPAGGVQTGPAVCPLLEEDAQLDTVRGQLVQHLAGEGIGAVRRSNIRTSGCVLLRPAAGASAFGEPAAPAGRQNGQAEQKHSGQTGGQQPAKQSDRPAYNVPQHSLLESVRLRRSAPEALFFIRRIRGRKGSAVVRKFSL